MAVKHYCLLQIGSVFSLKDYGDVFALLDQESRVRSIKKKEKSTWSCFLLQIGPTADVEGVLLVGLEEMRVTLDNLMTKDDEEVDIEKSILKTDPDCARAGELYKKLNLFESVVLSLEAKGFR